MVHLHLRRNFKKTTEMSLIRLVTSSSFAIFVTVWALYLKSFNLSNSVIGFIAAALMLVSFIFSFYSPFILEKFGDYVILKLSVFMIFISFLLIYLFDNLYAFIILSFIYTILYVLKTDSFDILFRDESDSESLNKAEGLMYALFNFGLFVGPFIAGYVMQLFNIRSTFLIAGLLMLGAYFMFYSMKAQIPYKEKIKNSESVLHLAKAFVEYKKTILPFLIVCGMYIWWSMIYIYIPLYIIDSGFDASIIGFFIGIVLLPLVIMDYFIGVLSQKYGFRKFFITGYFILFLLSLIMFFIHGNLYYVLVLCFIASFMIALIDPLQDSYFFKQITRSSDEERFYPIFATSEYFGHFIGRVAPAIVLLFLPVHYIFLSISFFMFILFLISLKVRD